MRIIKAVCPGSTLAASILGLVLVAMPSSAATPPELLVSVAGYGSVTVDSLGTETYTGTCDGSTCAGTVVVGNGSNGLQTGQISWTGTIGALTGSATGTSSHIATLPQLDLLMSGLITSAAATVTVSWTDVGFTAGVTPATMNVVGGGIGTSTYTSYTDATKTPFGTGTTVNTLTASGTATGPGPIGFPFSMTDTAVLTMPAGVGTSLPPDSIDFLFNDTPASSGNGCTPPSGSTAPVALCKSPSTPSISLAPGSPFPLVTYTYTVTNTGNSAVNDVVVTDDNSTPGYPNDDWTFTY